MERRRQTPIRGVTHLLLIRLSPLRFKDARFAPHPFFVFFGPAPDVKGKEDDGVHLW